LRYEVILSEPEVKVTPPKKAASPKNSMSVQDIEDKLKAAEERRQQLESNKIAALAAKMQKIEDASRKKDEQTSQFISATRDALEQKMENHTEKREAYITDLKTKLKDHIENVEKTRLSIEQQTDEVRSAIEEKLKTASVQRDENIKKMLERLKEHVSNQCRFVIGALLNIIINTSHSQMLACLCASSRKNKCKRSEPAMLLSSNN
jgi:stathmin